MIDTHCHLTFRGLAGDTPGVLARAADAGVTHVINIGTTLDDSRRGSALSGRYVNVAATAGVHPCYDESATLDARELRDVCLLPGIIAVGECGLDYFHHDVPRDVQRRSFLTQLDVAAELGLPVVVHSRESTDDCVAVLADFPAVRAVVHCFTAGVREAELLAEADHYVGFTGPLTYKKNDSLREACLRVPRDRVLVETDAPYLSPEPKRGVRPCEPAFVALTLARLAQVRGWTVAEADRVTTDNARRLFNWPADEAL